MPTRRQLIQKITLNADTSSVTFSNIPQNYTDLKILVSTRCSHSAVADLQMRFNGATTDANLSIRSIRGSGSSVISQNLSYGQVGFVSGTNYTSNTFSNIEIYLTNYTSSNNKSYKSTATTENNATESYIHQIAGLWSSTNNITSITLLPGAGNLISNSTFYLYGITQVPIIRGGEVSVRDGFKYHTFKSTSTLQVIEAGNIEYLIVAGGGGGGYAEGGGGGGGGLLNSRMQISSGTYTVSVGGGGNGSTSNSAGSQGTASSFNSISTTGGGGGGSNSTTAGGAGGSGGGGANAQTGGTGTSGQGYAGGSGVGFNHAAGGGGAGAVGGNSSTSLGGNGGSGTLAFGNYYSGGGGGSVWHTPAGTPGTGGVGGGGAGQIYSSTVTGAQLPGYNGSANSGGGGGGGGYGIPSPAGGTGGAGGSGIVIIRYPYDGN